MEVVKVCRICLVMDVNMHDLQRQPLETYLKTLIGNPLSAFELPPFACFECFELVKKYSYFRNKCLRGQATLYGILQSNGKITRQEIQKINRSSSQLASKLTIHKITQDNVIYHVHDEDSFNVKREPSAEDDKHKFKFENSIKEEVCFDNLSLLLTSDDDDELEESTEEECFDDFPLLSTDDDESLSLHTSNKVKKAKVKEKKKVKDKSKKDTTDPLKDIKVRSYVQEIPIELTKILPHKVKRDQSIKPKKLRRNAHAHTGVNIGELEEYVNVVELSIEEQMEEIKKRQQSSNYLNAPYQCKLCYKGFLNTQAWKHHSSKHDPSAGDIECPICKFRFKTHRPLRNHAARHSTKYVCKKCPYVSRCTNQARRHESWHKGVTYKCQYCGEVSTKWTSHLSHVRIKHPSEFICDLCGYSFVSKLGLNNHKSRMHKDVAEKKQSVNDNEADLYCKECDVKFISMEAFQRHMVTSVKHTQTTNINKGCRLCGEIFKNSKELRIHRKVHARKLPKFYGKKPTDTSWPVKCQQCSEEISNARDYWNHFRRSHPDKDYPIQKDNVCDICGKSFKNSSYMVYHKSTHSEERAYKCSTCGKAFRNTINLHNHERIHSDVRPYPCTVCYKAFKCKGALDRHFRCHTGVKPYVCQVCGKGFSQSNGRKLHISTVHMKQPAPPRSRLQRKNKP